MKPHDKVTNGYVSGVVIAVHNGYAWCEMEMLDCTKEMLTYHKDVLTIKPDDTPKVKNINFIQEKK